MRGNRERTAFQHKNKKFKQYFVQGLHSNGGQQFISYCNINDIPVVLKKESSCELPDYQTLVDFQVQLKKEQQKIEEKIKHELASTQYTTAFGKNFLLRNMTAERLEINHTGNGSASNLTHFNDPKKLNQQGPETLSLNGKHVQIEYQQANQRQKRIVLLQNLHQNNNNYSQINSSVVPPTASAIVTGGSSPQLQINHRALTPQKKSVKKKQSSPNNEKQNDNDTKTVLNIPNSIYEESQSNLSPKLLQSLQQRHGCEIEIKEEVAHENNQSSLDLQGMSIESEIRDQKIVNKIQSTSPQSGIKIAGNQACKIQKSPLIMQGQCQSTFAILQQNNPDQQLKLVTDQRDRLITPQVLQRDPLQILPTTTPTMMSKQHCNSTSLILNLQQTAIVGTKLKGGLNGLLQPSTGKDNNVSAPILPSFIEGGGSPSKKQLLRQIMPMNTTNIASVFPPLKKQVFFENPQILAISNQTMQNLNAMKDESIEQKQTINQNINTKIIQQPDKGITMIQPSMILKQLNKVKVNRVFDNSKAISEKPETSTLNTPSIQIESRILTRNQSANRISDQRNRKSFSRTSINQPWMGVNVSLTSTIASSNIIVNNNIQILQQQQQSKPQQIQVKNTINPTTSPPIPRLNRNDLNTTQINQATSQSNRKKQDKFVNTQNFSFKQPQQQQVVSTQQINNNHSLKKLMPDSLVASRGPPPPNLTHPQSQNQQQQQQQQIQQQLKTQNSFLLNPPQSSTAAVNRSTMAVSVGVVPQRPPPAPAVPNKSRLTGGLNENSRPTSKYGFLSGNRSTTINTQQNSTPKKQQLNTTVNYKQSQRNKSVPLGEQKQHSSETNFEFQTKANQIERNHRLQEQSSLPFMQQNFNADDQQSSSSEESDNAQDPEKVTEQLRELLNSNEAMDFNLYMAHQIQKKRERLIKNSFASHINTKRQGPNNTSYYEHIGYCPLDTTDKWRIHGAPAIDESTRASSAPESENNRGRPFLYKTIVKDQLKIFEDAEIEQIIEQAQSKVYPLVQAKQWAIAETKKGSTLYGRDTNQSNEIASQTKIMTAYVVMKVIEELEIVNVKDYYLRVTKKAERVIGTKAGLIEGQMISIYDCLHALMLPSGNDAALTLATAFGKYLHFVNLTEKRKNLPKDADEDLKKALLKHSNLSLKKLHEASTKMDNKLYINAFVAEMKKYTKLMKIDDSTNFTNPHGLSDKNNHSSPADVCRIASLAMKNKHLKEIVSRRYYECTVISREMNINLLQWFNSNKLLNDYFIGVKTGTTPSAGPCLCGYFQYGEFSIIACVMNTKSVDTRWKDMAILCLWALDKHLLGQQHRESLRPNDLAYLKK